MDPYLGTYRKIIVEWAESEATVIKAYIYGSRAKGDYKENSDLDVAIEIQQLYKDSNIASTWINEGDGLKERLQKKLPDVKLHLESLNVSMTVLCGVRQSGILIYQKQ